MIRQSFIVIDAERPERPPTSVDARVLDRRVQVNADSIATALGWELSPEGLCREGLCVPLPPGLGPDAEGDIDLLALVGALRRPVVVDIDERTACVGASADDRGDALASLEAPDFSLPDVEGRLHSLSDHRGRKVLLVVWASW
jgi:hypothetical protein